MNRDRVVPLLVTLVVAGVCVGLLVHCCDLNTGLSTENDFNRSLEDSKGTAIDSVARKTKLRDDFGKDLKIAQDDLELLRQTLANIENRLRGRVAYFRHPGTSQRVRWFQVGCR